MPLLLLLWGWCPFSAPAFKNTGIRLEADSKLPIMGLMPINKALAAESISEGILPAVQLATEHVHSKFLPNTSRLVLEWYDSELVQGRKLKWLDKPTQ